MIDPPGLVELSRADLLDQVLGRSIRHPITVLVLKDGKKHSVELGSFPPFRVKHVELVPDRYDPGVHLSRGSDADASYAGGHGIGGEKSRFQFLGNANG